MGLNEKRVLEDSITLEFAENFGLKISDVRERLDVILKSYRVSIDQIPENGNMMTEYLMEKFRNGKISIGMNMKTIEQYEIAVKLLERYTDKFLADIEAEDIRNFLIEYGKTVSSVTLRSKYQILNSIYSWLYERKLIGHNPMIYIDAPKATITVKKNISDLDIEKVKVACEKMKNKKESLRDMALIYFFISTGCRVSEACGVKIKDIDFQNKCCRVMGKGRKERFVVLTDSAIYRINMYLETRNDMTPESPLFSVVKGNERHISKDGAVRIMDRLKKKTGVTILTCHTFRRYYATELRKHNVGLQMIAKSLGHANLNQINRYSLFTDEEMLDEIRRSM